MSDWYRLALILAISAPIGLGLGVYLRRRHKSFANRLRSMGRTISWPYYAAGTVLFVTLAVGSRDNLPFLLFFCAFAALDLFWTVRVFLRERSQYSLRNLLITVTLAAIVMKLCLAFKMAAVTAVGVGAGGAALVLFALEWLKLKDAPEDTPESE